MERTLDELKTTFKSLETPLEDARRAFLEYTVRFYNLGNRALIGMGCVYESTLTSPGCAHGQHMTADVLDAIDSGLGIVDNNVWDYLDVWHQRLGKEFCCDIQAFHDIEENWTESGLSDFGKGSVVEIRAENAL